MGKARILNVALLACLVGGGMVGWQPAAIAQESEIDATANAPTEAQPQTQAAPRNRLMDEIVVTAQKREEDVQDVPISITAFSAEALDAKGINEPLDIAQFTPGMHYGKLVNFSIIYIRGIGTDAYLPDSDPSVATYIDGVYYPFANGQSHAFGAVERVEVLKGPQGTLFGRNATGGAINIVTAKPGDEFEAAAQASYAEFNDLRLRGYVNVPIADWLKLGISGTWQRADNYYEGTVAAGSQALPREEQGGFRARLLIQPLDTIEITLSFIDYSVDGLGSTAMPNTAPSALSQSLGIQAETGPYHLDVDVPSYFAMDNQVIYGELNWHPRWFDFKVLASQQDVTTDNNFDQDGSSTPFITFDARGQFADVAMAEMQLLSNGEWGPDWLEWIVGAFMMEQSTGFPRNRLSVASLDVTDGFIIIPNPTGTGPIPIALPQPFVDLLSMIPGAPDGGSFVLRSLQDAESLAFYAQGTVHLWDWLHLTAGGRWQKEKKIVVASSFGLGTLDHSDPVLQEFDRPQAETTNFAPKFVAAVDVLEDAMVYASWTKGFKSGTFNTVNIYDQPEYVRPEEVTTIELGFKSQFFGGLLQLNGALFKNEIEDLQVQFVSLFAGGAVLLENAASAEIKGVELDFQASPLPELFPGLVVFGSGAFLDSEYTSYPNASGYDEDTGFYNFSNGDFSGNRVNRAPRFSGQLGFNMLFAVGPGDLEVGASYHYTSKFYYLAQNSPVSEQAAYHVVDAQVNYFVPDWNARLTVYGRNLTDQVYSYGYLIGDAGRLQYNAPPRTIGIRLNAKY